ncbi:MAG: hypothetical protein M5U09_28895 [Gammaproteobacteria bacterium]|nr:hypothetical protein [Gammaproteobacteria bacterium]
MPGPFRDDGGDHHDDSKVHGPPHGRRDASRRRLGRRRDRDQYRLLRRRGHSRLRPGSLFHAPAPRRGSPEHAVEWLGATWHFASEEHRRLFSSDPVRYAPQYGGHCADGVAYGDLSRNIDPAAWRIIDGRLYLNYDQGAAAELVELEGQLDKAEANWPEVRQRLFGAAE